MRTAILMLAFCSLCFADLTNTENTKKCSNADQTLTYNYSESIGGAARGLHRDSEGSVKIGTTLYKVDMGGRRPDALTSFSATKVMIAEPVVKEDFKTTTYLVQLQVKPLGDSKLLYNGEVLCTESTYVGPPRPMSPPKKDE